MSEKEVELEHEIQELKDRVAYLGDEISHLQSKLRDAEFQDDKVFILVHHHKTVGIRLACAYESVDDAMLDGNQIGVSIRHSEYPSEHELLIYRGDGKLVRSYIVNHATWR